MCSMHVGCALYLTFDVTCNIILNNCHNNQLTIIPCLPTQQPLHGMVPMWPFSSILSLFPCGTRSCGVCVPLNGMSRDCKPRLQASFGSLGVVFHDLAEEPGSLHGTAPVDGETEPSVAVVVYHLKQSRYHHSLPH